MIEHSYDVVIIGSGAGGGTVALELAPLVRDGKRILVIEQGPRLRSHELTGVELDMAPALYEDGGAFLTADGAMTLAFGRVFGGSTMVYTGTTLVAPPRVIEGWAVPGLTAGDVEQRSTKYRGQNNVHLLEADAINENNRLFVEGCTRAGFRAEQFPLNLRGCMGASLCNLGCPNLAKQGTAQVQLPAAERQGVEVVTRAEVLSIPEARAVHVRVSEAAAGSKGAPSEWAPGDYLVRAGTIVVAGGSIGSSALLMRSRTTKHLRHLGRRFTCHPAHILVAEHDRELGNHIGHPKSFYLDRSVEEQFVLETCMYFPFVTAKNMTGFGDAHSRFMRAFPRLQMILVLACDHAVPQNRITVDRAGRPVVHYQFTHRTIRALVAATRTASRIFFAAGALRVHAPTADPPCIEREDAARIEELVSDRHFLAGRVSISAAHMMGGCSMGRDESDSVTDSRGRVHGMPWLRVADSALFPDSVEVNPYLTVMALADRVAEAVLSDIDALRAPVEVR